MRQSPVICFGQQPCGIFPRRYLYAKMQTARRMQAEMGGEIVFFFHDSDHDPRETKTLLRHRKNNEAFEINFTFENKLQRKYSPLYLKRVPTDWRDKTALQLPAFADKQYVDAFRQCPLSSVADFCLEMYTKMNLLHGMRIARSSDISLREAACDITDFFVDIPHEGEIVRAKWTGSDFKLHAGGDSYTTLPAQPFTKKQISPTRDSRLKWMQSILHCTHYIAGSGEQAYLNKSDAPDITFVSRDTIERPDEAYTEIAQ